MVYTEMVSSMAVLHKSRRTSSIIKYEEKERPVIAQLFGSSEKSIAEASKKLTSLGFDGIDINCGCPAKKILRSGSGAALLGDLALFARIIKAAADSTHLPVSVKFRPGIDSNNDKTELLARAAEESGARYLVIHARYASQVHSGEAVIEAICSAVNAVKIPVIANGGITDEFSAERIIKKTSCAGIMVGRAAIGDCGIFKRIGHYLSTGEKLPTPSREEKIQLLLDHASLAASFYGERWGVIKLRKMLPFYLKGLPGSKNVRSKINCVETFAELKKTLLNWQKTEETVFEFSEDFPARRGKNITFRSEVNEL